jgi:hypothetical protein
MLSKETFESFQKHVEKAAQFEKLLNSIVQRQTQTGDTDKLIIDDPNVRHAQIVADKFRHSSFPLDKQKYILEAQIRLASEFTEYISQQNQHQVADESDQRNGIYHALMVWCHLTSGREIPYYLQIPGVNLLDVIFPIEVREGIELPPALFPTNKSTTRPNTNN